MEIKNVYPQPPKRINRKSRVRQIFGWLFCIGAFVCALVNLCVGGEPWSLVVIWSLWMAWTIAFSHPLIENNLLSQSSRMLFNVCVLLVIISLAFKSHWLDFVLPLVCFCMVAVEGVFFFLNVRKQRQNIMPMLWVLFVSLIAACWALFGFSLRSWPVIVLAATATGILIASVVVLRGQFFSELRKRFHT